MNENIITMDISETFIEIVLNDLNISNVQFYKNIDDKNNNMYCFDEYYIDLMEINSNNFKNYCLLAAILYISNKVHHEFDSTYPFGITSRVMKTIPTFWDGIMKDAKILLPDLDNKNKNDIKIIKEFISIYIDRVVYIIKDYIDHSKISHEDGVTIGVTQHEKNLIISETLDNMTDVYASQLKEDNITFAEMDFLDKFNMEIEVMDLDEETEEEDVSDVHCKYCNEDNVIYVGANNYYCYDCDKTWRK